MPKKRKPGRRRLAGRMRFRKRQATIPIAVMLRAMLAYSGAVDPVLMQKAEPTGPVSVQSLNANAPSKEYIYAGARLVASEEPQGCTPVLTPAYQSFPATPSPPTGAINVGVGSGCNWTATSNATWITFPSGNSGTGSGTLAYSVAQNTSTSIREGTITIGGQSFKVYQGIDFADVPTTHPFYAFIGRLSARGVTAGCGTGCNTSGLPCFCPDQTVPHEQMAVFVIRAKGENPPTPPSQRFADVPPSHWAYAFIDRVDALNIWNGCGTNQFGQRIYCPSEAVRREQMAAMMIRGIGEFDPPTPPTQRFSDVLPSNVFYNFIDRMAALGITSGCSASPPLFCPTDSVTRGQMAVFLVRAFNL